MKKEDIMFDKDVAKFFRISLKTFQRRVLRPRKGELDPNKAEPCVIGGRRLWLRANVERVLNERMVLA